MTLWTVCSAHPLLSSESTGLSAPSLLTERPWTRPGHEDQQSLVRGQQCYTCCAFPLVLCFPLSIFSIKACLLFPRFQIKPRRWNERLCSKLPPKATIRVKGFLTSFSRKEILADLKPLPSIQKWVSLIMAKISKQINNLKKKKVSFTPIKQADLRRPMACASQRNGKQSFAMEMFVWFLVYKDELFWTCFALLAKCLASVLQNWLLSLALSEYKYFMCWPG